MYYVKSYASDFTTSGTGDATFQAVPLAFSFNVEEPEMWCELRVSGLAMHGTADDTAFVNLLIDGAYAIGTSTTLGLAAVKHHTATDATWISGMVRVRLAVGVHTLSVVLRSTTDTQTATLKGTVLPTKLEVLKLSNSNLLAHGQGAKFQTVE